MRRLSVALSVLLLSLWANSSKAQNLVNVAVSVPQYNQIYVADFDIQQVKSSGVLFTATLQSMAATQIQVKLNMFVNITLVGESPFQIAQATTVPIALNPGQTKVVTNVDLSGDNPAIRLENYSYDQAEYDKIKNVALATGKAPAGTYEFVLSCTGVDGKSVSNTATADIIVTNPSRVDLAFPNNGENVTTPFPRFQWSANVDTVVLSVYQKLPYQQSPQDVVSGVPSLQQTVAGSSFNYPPTGSGVRPLQNGNTYYWFVEIPASSTRGNGIRSDIWSFAVAASDTTSVSAGNINDAATRALINLLTGTQYQSLLSQITMLNGTASYDGSSIGTQQLIEILQNLDKSKITNVNVVQ